MLQTMNTQKPVRLSGFLAYTHARLLENNPREAEVFASRVMKSASTDFVHLDRGDYLDVCHRADLVKAREDS